MTGKLIKVDKNGSKHYEGVVICDRCGGSGVYVWGAMINGSPQYAGTCFKCDGAGMVVDRWIERTPEYQAKLDAKRQEKFEKRRAAFEAAEKARLEREAQREAEIKAKKAISQFIGNVGDKIDMVLEYVSCGNWQMHYGWQTQTMYAHTFKDENGNVFVWKTTNYIGNVEIGDKVQVKGTIKDHEEYKEQKQTYLTRCKVGA